VTGARIHATLDDKAFQAAVAKLGGVIRPGILRAIGTGLVEVVQRRFEAARDPFGGAWVALNPAYAAIKKGPGILREQGHLRSNITLDASGNRITIGSTMIYAGVHQFGATIKPVRAKALAFRMGGGGKGGRIVKAKSVTIPARPYLGFGPEDQREVMEVLQGFVDRSVSG
jgi:phage virion morphogenesis protein